MRYRDCTHIDDTTQRSRMLIVFAVPLFVCGVHGCAQPNEDKQALTILRPVCVPAPPELDLRSATLMQYAQGILQDKLLPAVEYNVEIRTVSKSECVFEFHPRYRNYADVLAIRLTAAVEEDWDDISTNNECMRRYFGKPPPSTVASSQAPAS